MRIKKALPRDEVTALYEAGNTLREIGNLFDVSAQTVLNRMKEWGIQRRGCHLRRGTKQTPEHIAKRIAPLLGRKLSAAAREHLSRSMKGRPGWSKNMRKATHPDKLARIGNPGSKHWNWKGGISAPLVRLRQSSEYKAWRDAVFRRDNFTCCACGKRGGPLEADHIKSFAGYPELRFAAENGRTMCKPCHRERTKEQRHGR